MNEILRQTTQNAFQLPGPPVGPECVGLSEVTGEQVQ